MSNFRDSTIGSVVILAVICFVITASLVGTNALTYEKIEEQRVERINDALAEVLPGVSDFEEITDIEMPAGINSAYKAKDNSGYAFSVQGNGYDGAVVFIVGMNNNGEYQGIIMSDNTETQGIGTRVGEAEHLEKYRGQTDPYKVDTVATATRTSNALIEALEYCNEAFELIK